MNNKEYLNEEFIRIVRSNLFDECDVCFVYYSYITGLGFISAGSTIDNILIEDYSLFNLMDTLGEDYEFFYRRSDKDFILYVMSKDNIDAIENFERSSLIKYS